MRVARFVAAALVAGSLLPAVAMAQNAGPTASGAAQAEKVAPKAHKTSVKHHVHHTHHYYHHMHHVAAKKGGAH